MFTKEKGTQTGLYCGDCGKWIKWVGKDEKNLIERWIAENKEPIEQDKNVVISEEDTINNLCKQISDYVHKNYNPHTSVIITETDITVVENVSHNIIERY